MERCSAGAARPPRPCAKPRPPCGATRAGARPMIGPDSSFKATGAYPGVNPFLQPRICLLMLEGKPRAPMEDRNDEHHDRIDFLVPHRGAPELRGRPTS